jgi:xanthine dehydrogenase accessory factor
MTSMAFFARLAELERERIAFAIATVVARRSPVSSHVGDRALILASGAMDGFVGGACARDVVRREALRAIRTGRSRLLKIRPAGGASDDETVGDELVAPMGCVSGGSVDVFIEAHLPLRRLIVVGDTDVADALARVAAQVPYDVVRVVEAGELDDIDAVAGVRPIALAALGDLLHADGAEACSRAIAVVASQGHYDEDALEALLAVQPAFVGLLASLRRTAEVAATLTLRGVAADQLATIHAPVGLDLGARAPGDVAIAILAEIVRATTALLLPAETVEVRVGIDPVCGMEVDLATARYRLERDGNAYVFCCAGCQAQFVPA